MKPDVPQITLHWKPCWRVIPTRYPEINLWRRVALPEDEKAVDIIERLTNNRVRQELGEINVLRTGDFFPKNCANDVIATFAYRGIGSRFSTKTFAAYYATKSLKTAVYEKAHRTKKLLTDAKIPATQVDMRVIKAEIRAKVYDVRGMQKALPALYHPDHYTSSQQWATHVWTQGAQGIVYDSVRQPGGQCAAIFSPQTITHCHKDRILSFEWNGKDTLAIAELKEFLSVKS
jgi:hypothetical protein